MRSLSLSRLTPPLSVGLLRHMRLFGALGMALLLNACAVQHPQPQSEPTPQRAPAKAAPARVSPPVRRPAIQAQPTKSSQRQTTSKTHPRYAPPPHVAAHWDNRLGVYVVEGQPLYYRERLYYRWSDGWYGSDRPNGPWEPLNGPSVPPGLHNRHP